MPHFEEEIEGKRYTLPEIAPEDLLPKTPPRPKKDPLQPKTEEPKSGHSFLGKVSIKKWKPSDDLDDEMSGIMDNIIDNYGTQI
jgi:hypothetical protein